MPAPTNTFKARLAAGETLFGCWLALADAYTTEVVGTAGFDWLVIDGEHSPNDLRSIRDQLMALESSESHPVVRVPIGADWLIKQVLDIGAQTVLVPMVDSADQARDLVRAVRYPPHGVRGVGSALGRASRFAEITDYIQTANDQICLLVQVESVAGIEALSDILKVEGVDGVFIGPADLSADMGYAGNAAAPEVQNVIMNALSQIEASGKAAGILSMRDEMTENARAAGARFIAVSADVALLATAARSLAAKWKS